MKIIKKYLYQLKINKKEEILKKEILNEINDPYIIFNRKITYLDNKYFVVHDKDHYILDLIGNSGRIYSYDEKIPFDDVLPDWLLNKIKQFIRFKKFKQFI